MNKTINKIPIRNQIINILIEQILTGEVKPGDRLKELHIAKELNVSQAPVREAFRSLEAMGYVEHKPNSGTSVREFHPRELIEIYQVREGLELQAVKVGFERLGEGEEYDTVVIALESCLKEMQKALADNDRKVYSQHNTEFHRILLKMSGNNLIMLMWESLEVQSRVIHTMYSKNVIFQSVLDLHVPIFSALKDRNKALLLEKISDHYLYIIKTYEDSLKERDLM